MLLPLYYEQRKILPKLKVYLCAFVLWCLNKGIHTNSFIVKDGHAKYVLREIVSNKIYRMYKRRHRIDFTTDY